MDAAIQTAIDQAVATAQAALEAQLLAATNDLTATRNDLTTAQAALTAAQAQIGVLQIALTAPPAGPAVAPAVQFAYSSATVSNDVIDYKTPAGIKLYKLAGDKLKTEFDLDSNQFTLFLDRQSSYKVLRAGLG